MKKYEIVGVLGTWNVLLTENMVFIREVGRYEQRALIYRFMTSFSGRTALHGWAVFNHASLSNVHFLAVVLLRRVCGFDPS